MILAVDIGNTNIVIGCVEGKKIKFTERLSTNHKATELEYAILFKNVLEIYSIRLEDISGGIISSVVPSITKVIKSAMEKITSENILIIDDFLAIGNALNGLMDIVSQAGGKTAGVAIAIEKGFQGGGDKLRSRGVRVESLAIVDSMTDDSVKFRP